MSIAVSDKKKVFGLPYNIGISLLCVLGAAVLYAFYSNVLAGPSLPSPSPDSARSTPAVPSGDPAIPVSGTGADAPLRRPVSTQRRSAEEFSPKVHNKEAKIDAKTIDPELRLDLLAKVQAVELAGGTRNLFQFGTAPKPPEALAGPEAIVRPVIGPRPPPVKVEPTAAPPPPPPPITLKFYGFSTVIRNGKKTAYFMDGDDIAIAAEGEMVKRRYLVKRILATSVQVEDTEGKRVVTIPITEETPS
jgi:hypothetical protein